MKSVSLNATARSLGRRAGAKKLRAEGRIPAVIYGRQAQPQNLELQARGMVNEVLHFAGLNFEPLGFGLAAIDDGGDAAFGAQFFSAGAPSEVTRHCV